jgi:hypothetical protein
LHHQLNTTECTNTKCAQYGQIAQFKMTKTSVVTVKIRLKLQYQHTQY